MRQLITALALLLSSATTFFAEAFTIPVTPAENGETPTVDNPNKHKMPPAPVFCTIDIEEGTVTCSSPRLDSIESYEVWSADGDVCLASSSDAEDFTATLSALASGDYTIRLVCHEYYYTGIINL